MQETWPMFQYYLYNKLIQHQILMLYNKQQNDCSAYLDKNRSSFYFLDVSETCDEQTSNPTCQMVRYTEASGKISAETLCLADIYLLI